MNHSKNSEMDNKAKVPEGQKAGGGCVTEKGIKTKSVCSLATIPTRGCPASQNNHYYLEVVVLGGHLLIEGHRLTQVSCISDLSWEVIC